MKRTFAFIYIVSFISLFSVIFCGRIIDEKKDEFLKSINIKPNSIAIKDLGLSGIIFDVDLLIENRSDISVTFTEIDYKIYHKGKLLGSGNNKERITIKAMGDTNITLPLKIRYKDAIIMLMTIDRSKPFRVVGRVRVETLFGYSYVDFDREIYLKE